MSGKEPEASFKVNVNKKKWSFNMPQKKALKVIGIIAGVVIFVKFIVLPVRQELKLRFAERDIGSLVTVLENNEKTKET